MTDKNTPQRYHIIAVILHWMMAIAFIGMIISGLLMTSDLLESFQKFALYQWHKSFGVTLLLLFFIRITVRILSKAPQLPATFQRPEKLAAKAGHHLLYGFMIAMPVTGWVMVSSSSYDIPTLVFEWFEWPHLSMFAGDEAINNASKTAHQFLGYGFAAVIVLHIAAVIKHAMIDRQNLLKRMSVSFKKAKTE